MLKGFSGIYFMFQEKNYRRELGIGTLRRARDKIGHWALGPNEGAQDKIGHWACNLLIGYY